MVAKKRFNEPGVNLRHLTASLSGDKKSTVVLCLALQQKGYEIIKECVRLHKDGVTSCKSVDGVCKKEDPSGDMRNEERAPRELVFGPVTFALRELERGMSGRY